MLRVGSQSGTLEDGAMLDLYDELRQVAQALAAALEGLAEDDTP